MRLDQKPEKDAVCYRYHSYNQMIQHVLEDKGGRTMERHGEEGILYPEN
jgi:hypothetical protein